MDLPLIPLGILLVRPGMLVTATPVLGGTFAPSTVKVALVGILAVVLLPVVAMPAAVAPGTLALVLMREAVIGLAIAMSVRTVVAAAEFAGHLTGFQVGFTYANVIDPQSGVRNSTISALYGGLAVFVFLAVDGHHALLRVITGSYESLPIGLGSLDRSAYTVVPKIFGVVFGVGLQLSAPVLIVLLVVEVAMGMVARVAPSLNLLNFGFPIRLVAGLMAIAVMLQSLPGILNASIEPAMALATAAARIFR
ncbi:MAG: flagellar biosynthetic protein FliR [Vicinamibacterales bacterium]